MKKEPAGTSGSSLFTFGAKSADSTGAAPASSGMSFGAKKTDSNTSGSASLFGGAQNTDGAKPVLTGLGGGNLSFGSGGALPIPKASEGEKDSCLPASTSSSLFGATKPLSVGSSFGSCGGCAWRG